MKKLLLNSFIIVGLFMSGGLFNSCAEYTYEPLPSNFQQTPQSGSLNIKILSGSEAGKSFTSSGPSAVMGTKRVMNGEFMAYQIVGGNTQVQFFCQITNENGISPLEELTISIQDLTQGIAYMSTDDSNGSIKIEGIKLLQSYDAVGAQIMNGKVTFKGKFDKINGLETIESNIEIEGTVNF